MTLQQEKPGADLANKCACLTMFRIVPLRSLLGSFCMSSVQMRRTLGCVQFARDEVQPKAVQAAFLAYGSVQTLPVLLSGFVYFTAVS